jgi:hypothetical protein
MNNEEVKSYYQYHNANMRLIKIGFYTVRQQIKALFKKRNWSGNHIYLFDDGNEEKMALRMAETALSRVLSGIQVSWAEEGLKRLLYENDVFSEDQRMHIIRTPALDQKWINCFHIVFCIAYDLVPNTQPACETVVVDDQRVNLGDDLVNQYLRLKGIINSYVIPSFSIRNKVQHGEWVFAFKPRFSEEFSQDITNKIQHENIVTTTSRFVLVNAVYQMILDMARFKSNAFALDSMQTPFEYYYQAYLQKILFELQKIKTPELDSYISEMIHRELRGEAFRSANQAINTEN